MRMTREAYARIIAENIAWCEAQPRTLERDHTILVLRQSIDEEYLHPLSHEDAERWAARLRVVSVNSDNSEEIDGAIKAALLAASRGEYTRGEAMSEAKFEPVTEAELAQLRELHEASLTSQGWLETPTATARYKAFAVALAPRMAAHLRALMTEQSVRENLHGGTTADGEACVQHGGNVPDGMTLVSASELARLRAVDFELKQARRDERRMSEHS